MRFVRSFCVAAAISIPAAASAVTLDFDSGVFTPGTYSQDGLVFSLSSTGANAGPNLFNTLCTGYGAPDGCNGDIDLVPGVANTTGGNQGQDGVSGNVLILQADEQGKPNPNDDANGGTITFTFVSGNPFSIMGFSVVDDGDFEMLTSMDGSVGAVNLPGDNDTAMVSVTTGLFTPGDTFTLNYNTDSGAFDSIVLDVVPVPAALPLLLAGLGGFAVLRRRRKAA